MSFKEVSALDADVTVALGKKDKATGKPYPKQAEGYYLGNRIVKNKRGDSTLHFLQTENGNLGVWGTTDLNRKVSQVPPGTMIRITSTGTKPTPNGDMYTYKVEIDTENTIEVSAAEPTYSNDNDSDDSSYVEEGNGASNDSDEDTAALLAAKRAEQAAKVQEIMNRGKGKTK